VKEKSFESHFALLFMPGTKNSRRNSFWDFMDEIIKVLNYQIQGEFGIESYKYIYISIAFLFVVTRPNVGLRRTPELASRNGLNY